MTSTESIPLLVFVLVATFTPGPGNIASATMGMIYGYRRSLSFLAGIVAGYSLVILLCAALSGTLLELLPRVEPVLRIIGAGYILWLAIATLRASYGASAEDSSPMQFKHGFLLQALNPKAVIFGITIYTTFLSGYTSDLLFVTSSVTLLAAFTFCSISTWAFAGDRIQKHLHQRHIRQLLNLVLFTLLVYCALTLSGIV